MKCKAINKAIKLCAWCVMLFLSICVLCNTAPDAEAAVVASGSCGTDLIWILDDQGTLTISGTGAMTNWTSSSKAPWYSKSNAIKKVVIGNDVTSIGSCAFYYCSNLTSVTIGNGVTYIGDRAFYECTGLTEINFNAVNMSGLGQYNDVFAYAGQSSSGIKVTIGKDVTKIPAYLFSVCNYDDPKITTVKFEKGTICESIGNYAFVSCDGLTSVTIPNSVTTIGDSAFSSCVGLTSVTIPNSVTTIDNYAFYKCTGLTSVTIPNSVTNIGYSAFRGCTGLIRILVDSNNPNYSNDSYGVLFDKNKTTLICFPNARLGAYSIPDSVTKISAYAFYNCTGLTSVTIPNSVTTIGDSAFYNCTGLTSITIPVGLTDIRNEAFSYCTSLTEIYFNAVNMNDMTYKDSVFYNAGQSGSGIKVTIGKDVTNIPAYLFNGYNGRVSTVLTPEITIVEFEKGSVCKSIGDSAFYRCSDLTLVTIPDSVTTIGDGTFANCTNLILVKIPDSVISVGGSAFADTAWYDNQPSGLIYTGKVAYKYKGKGVSSLRIQNGTTAIADDAFQDCTGLTSVSIPDSVTNIGNSAFRGCTGLTSVTIPNSVTTIGDSAFYNCTGLTSVTIPNSVTTIGNSAFRGCTGLTSVTIPDSVTTIGRSAFYECTGLTSVTIGNGVETIGDYAFYNCTNLNKINFNAVNMTDLSYPNYVFYKAGQSGTGIKVIIGRNVTRIPGRLFYPYAYDSCYPNITMVEFEEGGVCKSAGINAFDSCQNLTGVYISDLKAWFEINFESRAANPLRYAGKLYLNDNIVTQLVVPNSVTTIGQYAFCGFGSLTSITIPNSVTSIGEHAFVYCKNLNIVHYTGSESQWKAISGILDSDLERKPHYIEFVDNCEKTLWFCEFCNTFVIDIAKESGKHIYDDVCDTVCNVCDYLRTVPHSYTSECDTSCNLCGLQRSETSAHTYDNACDTNCNVCGEVRTINHSYSANCDKSCNVCGHVRTGTSIHTYDNVCDTTCNACGTTRTVPDHVYIRVCDTVCINCGYIRDAQHTFANGVCTICSLKQYPITIKVTATSVMLTLYTGYEYSKDGITWHSSNEFTGLTPNTTYKFYQRLAGTQTSPASSSSSALTVTTPKTAVSAPVAPVLQSKTDSSVTLQAKSGYEYSRNGTTWQSSNVFTGLTPNTSYMFYQRIAETQTSYASGSSSALTVTTPKATVSAPAAPVLQSKTDSSVTLQAKSGYEYSKDGTNWQTDSIFEGLNPNQSYTFYQRVAESQTNYASAKSSGLSVTTEKKTGYSAGTPRLITVSQTTVELQQYDTYEYSKDGTTWQKSATFTGLSFSTTYTFYQRVAETSTTSAGQKSQGLKVTTLGKNNCLNTPLAPIVAASNTSSVTLLALDGYEYKCGSGSWQSSNQFNGLSAGTSYTFYQRIKATATENASTTSQGVTYKTPKAGKSTATNHEKVTNYLAMYGSTAQNGNKYINVTYNGQSYYLAKQPNGNIYISKTTQKESGSTLLTYTTSLVVPKNSKYVQADMYLVIVSGSSASANVSESFNRATYTTDTTILLDDYAKGSLVADLYNTNVKLLCSVLGLFLVDELGMGLSDIGFLAYDKSVSGMGTSCCDPVSGTHIGTKELRHQYAATCTVNGYTGDYYCNSCGEKMSSGSQIRASGSHKYSNACDDSCNICGFKRVVIHSYSNSCDDVCNVCQATREIGHSYDNECDITCNKCGETDKLSASHEYTNACDTNCNTCGAIRTITHSYDNSCDTACNVCGATRTISHTYDAICDEACNVCKEERIVTHTYVGGCDEYCDVCGVHREPVGDHSFGADDLCTVCGEPDWVKGDYDGNEVIDNKDVEYLLWHTLFPEDYPLPGSGDLTGDGSVDNKDVEYLLWHTLFPEDYPLTIASAKKKEF